MLSVCELFGETIRNVFGCICYFVVECYGWKCLVCVVPVIPMGAGRFDTICTAAYVRCDSSTACRLCRLEFSEEILVVVYPLP